MRDLTGTTDRTLRLFVEERLDHVEGILVSITAAVALARHVGAPVQDLVAGVEKAYRDYAAAEGSPEVIAPHARYFLGRDVDSRWYLVPADRREDWDRWVDDTKDVPGDSHRETPGWARKLAMGPSSITFALWDGPLR